MFMGIVGRTLSGRILPFPGVIIRLPKVFIWLRGAYYQVSDSTYRDAGASNFRCRHVVIPSRRRLRSLQATSLTCNTAQKGWSGEPGSSSGKQLECARAREWVFVVLEARLGTTLAICLLGE